MAGHRRNNEVLIERQRVVKMRRRRDIYEKRQAAAHGPDEQLTAAVDYLRSVLKVVPPRLSGPMVTAIVEAIVTAADRLAAAWSREGGFSR